MPPSMFDEQLAFKLIKRFGRIPDTRERLLAIVRKFPKIGTRTAYICFPEVKNFHSFKCRLSGIRMDVIKEKLHAKLGIG